MKRICILFVILLALASTTSAWQYKAPTPIFDDSSGTAWFLLTIANTAAETSVVVNMGNTDLSKTEFMIYEEDTDTATFTFTLWGCAFPTFDSTLSFWMMDSVYMLATVAHQTVLWQPYCRVISPLVGLYPAADTATGLVYTGYKNINPPYIFFTIRRIGLGTVGSATTGTAKFKIFMHVKQPA